LLGCWRDRGTSFWRPLLSHGAEFGSKALAQYRGTNLVEATFESRYRSLLASSGAYPGLWLSVILLTAETKCKNCDKKMTFIVRVRRRSKFKTVTMIEVLSHAFAQSVTEV